MVAREVGAMNCPPGKSNKNTKEEWMAWKTPKIVEIALGAEINSYACAEVK